MAQLDVKLTRSSPLFFGWRLRDALCDVCGSRLPGSWLRQLRRPPGLSALLRRYVIAHMPHCDMCAPVVRSAASWAEGLSLSSSHARSFSKHRGFGGPRITNPTERLRSFGVKAYGIAQVLKRVRGDPR